MSTSPVTETVARRNAALQASLPFRDTQDLEDAERGRIGGLDPAVVTVAFTASDGTDAGGAQTVSLPGQGVINLPGWPAGQTTDMGRVDVTPAAGSPPVLAILARHDLVSQDTDAILPFVVTP